MERGKTKIALLHYQPLEKYPPVINLINFLAEREESIQTWIFTTDNINRNNWYQHKSKTIAIRRSPATCESRVQRYTSHLLFFIKAFLYLVYYKPSVLVVYETYSCLPAYAYLKMNKSVRVLMHHHEFVSDAEVQDGTKYFQFLTGIEEKLLLKAEWISQTNIDRLQLYKKRFPHISADVFRVMPNYPPLSWYYKQSSQNKIISHFVFAGALGMESMYVREFSEWIHSMNGAVTWNIYSNNLAKEAEQFFKELDSPFIIFNESVPYNQLPGILRKYDAGVILYKGINENQQLSVPNKLIEYYACGLDIWCPKELVSSAAFKKEYHIDSIKMIDFKDVNSFNSNLIKEHSPSDAVFTAESEYNVMLNAILEKQQYKTFQ
ncbi:MAG TPA: hypothetical protein DCQ29_12690 [Chitinophagaceae bacterium]|nr:hypothetical protein [Chitinophagaceae bacterium]